MNALSLGIWITRWAWILRMTESLSRKHESGAAIRNKMSLLYEIPRQNIERLILVFWLEDLLENGFHQRMRHWFDSYAPDSPIRNRIDCHNPEILSRLNPHSIPDVWLVTANFYIGLNSFRPIEQTPFLIGSSSKNDAGPLKRVWYPILCWMFQFESKLSKMLLPYDHCFHSFIDFFCICDEVRWPIRKGDMRPMTWNNGRKTSKNQQHEESFE
jgi:hypothetical protein